MPSPTGDRHNSSNWAMLVASLELVIPKPLHDPRKEWNYVVKAMPQRTKPEEP